MKKVLVSMLCMSSMAGMAQEKGQKFKNTGREPKVVIKGKLDQAPNGSRVVMYEPYSGESDSAVIKNHGFELRMPMEKGGSMYILQIGQKPTMENGHGTVVYLEEGEMNIRGKGEGFYDASFTGSPFVKEWQEVMDICNPRKGDGLRFAQLQKQYEEALVVGDEDVMNTVNAEAAVIDGRMKDKLKKWVTDHPNSGVCGYILTVHFSKSKEFVDSVYETLGDHAKASRILQRYKFPGDVDPRPVNISGGDGQSTVTAGKAQPGTAAPDFTIPDMAGNPVSLSSYKGKYVFIDFWASWCSPCIAQIPHLKEINEQYKGKNFQLLAVSLDSKREGWEKAVQKHDLTWLNVSNLKGWGEPVAGMYGITYLPSNVLIDPAGNIVAYDLYGDALQAKLKELIK